METKSKTELWLDLPDSADEISRLNTAGFVWVLVTAITANLLFGGVSSGALGLLSVMLAIGVVFWIAESLFAKRLRYSVTPLQLPFLALIGVGLIQLVPLGGEAVSSDLLRVQASSALTIEPYATKLMILKIVIFFLFFSSVLIYFDSAKRLRATVYVLMIFGGLMSFIGIIQKLSSPNIMLWIRQVDYAQPFASYVNQHHFAAFLVMMIALTLGLLFSGATRPDNRLLLIIAVVVMGCGIVFTGSRGALISLIAVLAFISFLNLRTELKTKGLKLSAALRSKAIVLIGANVALLVFLFLSVSWLGRGNMVLRQTGITGPEEFSNGRIEFWQNSLEIIKDNPLIGTGLGTFGVAYTRYDDWNGALRVEHAHNDYLEILATSGIVGFIIVGAFIFLLFRQGLRTVSSTDNPYRRGIAAGALAGCFGILVHSLFDFPLQTNANMFFFLICAALATVPVKFPAVRRKKTIKRVRREPVKT